MGDTVSTPGQEGRNPDGATRAETDPHHLKKRKNVPALHRPSGNPKAKPRAKLPEEHPRDKLFKSFYDKPKQRRPTLAELASTTKWTVQLNESEETRMTTTMITADQTGKDGPVGPTVTRTGGKASWKMKKSVKAILISEYMGDLLHRSYTDDRTGTSVGREFTEPAEMEEETGQKIIPADILNIQRASAIETGLKGNGVQSAIEEINLERSTTQHPDAQKHSSPVENKPHIKASHFGETQQGKSNGETKRHKERKAKVEKDEDYRKYKKDTHAYRAETNRIGKTQDIRDLRKEEKAPRKYKERGKKEPKPEEEYKTYTIQEIM